MQRNGLLASLGPQSSSLSSRLLNRHPTQLARHAVSQPAFAPIRSAESPVDRIVAIPHILESIVAYSTRSTQVTLLRVCHVFHRMAGKKLYRVIKLETGHGHTAIHQVLRGALIGTGSHGRSPSCEQCTGSMSDLFDTPIDDLEHHIQTTVKQYLASSTTGLTAMDLVMDVVLGGRDTPSLKPYATNFKRSLLKFTEVITVGSHHSCTCAILADHWQSLFPNVKTLRVAPSKSINPFVLQPTCDGDEPCPLLTRLRPRKIVLRNLDGHGIHIPSTFVWDVPSLETVVFFLPVDGRECDGQLMFSLMPHFSSAKEIKVVFHDRHEGTIPVEELVERTVLGRYPHNADNVILMLGGATFSKSAAAENADGEAIIQAMAPMLGGFYDQWNKMAQLDSAPKCTVYGVGSLSISIADSSWVSLYSQLFPSHAITRKKVVEIIKQEVRSHALLHTFFKPDAPFDKAKWNSGKHEVEFHGLKAYKEDKAARVAEINAED
ncbi:hypothetical protein Q8F55_004919 [Vanrija albida]|uniref:F-box domain-containing protein n=1 Tax=Vanrija albida TaxID=181172 RepID=A0ABR3Q057_9TREE